MVTTASLLRIVRPDLPNAWWVAGYMVGPSGSGHLPGDRRAVTGDGWVMGQAKIGS